MIRISHPSRVLAGEIDLPSSKSIYNRLLILKDLYFPGMQIDAAVSSHDILILTQQLQQIKVIDDIQEVNAQDAGTAFRFLMAYLCTQKGNFLLTGSRRMLQRPLFGLIKCLDEIGFQVRFHNKSMMSPVLIRSNGMSDLKIHDWEVDISETSQFASALSMIAPMAKEPVTIELTGSAVSLSYLDMTIKLMQKLGISISRNKNKIQVYPYESSEYRFKMEVERDWSGASYFFALASLADTANISLMNLDTDSIQPDVEILSFGKHYGLQLKTVSTGLEIKSTNPKPLSIKIKRDYRFTPDLAPTELIAHWANGIEVEVSGTTHLNLKESNRLDNLKVEFEKFKDSIADAPIFETYDDHRMAMSLALLAIRKDIIIKNSEVVKKSFPDFWNQLRTLGFEITQVVE